MNTRTLGKAGETLAAELLAKKGFEIIATNWHAPRNLGIGGELDIVARQNDVLVVVEVKLRRNTDFGAPIESVTPKKQAQLMQLAELFQQANPELQNLQLRFDVISILRDPGQSAPVVTHDENVL